MAAQATEIATAEAAKQAAQIAQAAAQKKKEAAIAEKAKLKAGSWNQMSPL